MKMSKDIWFKGASQIKGPLMIVHGVKGVSYGEICEVKTSNGIVKGQVLDVSDSKAVIQLFSDSMGLDLNAKVAFKGESATFSVSEKMLGKTFNGMGECLSDETYVGDEAKDINGQSINPAARKQPSDFVQTGISSIDAMISLVKGQKLPIFSSNGLPHSEIASRIVQKADIPGKKFVVVFAAMGVTSEEANFFKSELKKGGSMDRTLFVLNKADDSAVERIMTPRVALTAAEYLAFDKGYDVLVVMSDFTNYCESLREISSARDEIPGRRGYPGYMYTDLASNYERAGMIKGKEGSITQIPILTMPGDDKTHPVPDLTGYITEGQVTLDRSLMNKGINPPINPLPSLSRLAGLGIGKGKTREDHKALRDQLYDSYATSLDVRQVASIVGEESLSESDKKYLKFADVFEKNFLNQEASENRSISKTLDVGWKTLKDLPRSELKKLKPAMIEKYLGDS